MSIMTIKILFAAFMIFQVEYYGSPVGLKSIAQISTPDASSLLIQPYDKSRYSICQLAELNRFWKSFGIYWSLVCARYLIKIKHYTD